MKRVFSTKLDLIRDSVHRGQRVLDVGFWGQGVQPTDPAWPHRLLQDIGADVYGVDLELPEGRMPVERYFRQNIERLELPVSFDVIIGLDVIEHLSNQGLFLDAAKRHIAPGGSLLLATPNAFTFYHLAEKLTKEDPTVNRDHTCYYTIRTLQALLEKNGWRLRETGYIRTAPATFRPSWKKRVLDVLYRSLVRISPKFSESFYVIAEPRP